MSSFPEKPGQSSPAGHPSADLGAPMKTAPQGPRFGPDDLKHSGSSIEALAHWDELDARLLEEIEAHPQHGPRLAMLRSVDRWLVDRAEAACATSGRSKPIGCPSSEELYDFGRGPGYAPLPAGRKRAIDRHLLHCRDCEFLVETLASPPPVPMEVAPIRHEVRAVEPGPMTVIGNARDGARAPRRWVALATAAAIVAALGIWRVMDARESRARGFPLAPLLRGESGQVLRFPRDRVLPASSSLHTGWPAVPSKLLFEVEPQTEASTYRIDLFRHGGEAFARGEIVMSRTGAHPFVEEELALAPGHYTWEAWVVVHGLDRSLGARDFEVVENAALDAQLLALGSESEPERSLSAVELLHERGYRTDARALARRMSSTPERDAYLGEVPGR